MQILKNGGKSAAYECEFRNTDVFYYPNGKIKYKLGDDDMISHFRCIGSLEYESKFGEVNPELIDYYVFFADGKQYLDVQNSADSTFVRLDLSLTKSELEKIKAITRL